MKEKIEKGPDTTTRPRTFSSSFNYLLLDADKVLSAFGKYGKYQMLTYFITNSVHMLFAINMMVMPFITKLATFQCDFEPDSKWARIPDDECHVLNSSDNVTVKCLQVPGAKYHFDSPHSSLSGDFGLVCDEYDRIDHGSSIFMLGGLIIYPFISQLSDSYGRRFTFLFPLYLTVIVNICCAFSPTYTFFLIFRFISGVVTTGFTTIGYVLCMESVASEFRSKIPALAAVTWVIGYTLAGLLSMFITNWRLLYLAISVPGLLTIPFYWLTPESLHWLITNRKGHRVQKYINTCQNFNKKQISLHECRSESAESNEKEAVRRTALDIFMNKSILFHVIINAFILIVMNGTYWALSLFSTELSDDGLTGYFLSGLIELPAGFLSVYLLHAFKRKTVSILALVFTSIFMFCALYLPVAGNIKMVFPLLAKATNSIIWASQPLIYSESVPTSIRNVFCGIVSFLGDFGSVVAPYLKRLEAIDPNAPSLVIAILSLIASLCVLVLPETKNKKLPEDICDFDAGPLLRRFARRAVEEKESTEEAIALNSSEIELEAGESKESQNNEESTTTVQEINEHKRD